MSTLLLVLLLRFTVFVSAIESFEAENPTKQASLLKQQLPFNTFQVKSVRFDLVTLSRLIVNETSSRNQSSFAALEDNENNFPKAKLNKTLISLRKADPKDRVGIFGNKTNEM
jgi:hypothetical protein